MRIQIKGGVWKNTEDEILKAAVMKYGLNQWARISSLLVRKSAKQCKARWFEWLDPSIKKTEWTREEDEKLLHLAKLMPTQWRTIAPIVGRTPAQCLDRYEKLLDMAVSKEDKYDPADDPRRLRPGEIDPNPESKPARPDAVDMDEEEKEMLSEARARLANTRGKKAKRKAREHQMEEARRLASLQKKRELKAAGIETGQKRRNFAVDYSAEVAFEKKPAAGFFDVGEEQLRSKEMQQEFRPVTVEELEGRRRRDVEEALIKRDLKRQKINEAHNAPEVLAREAAAADPVMVRRRGRMMLPAPQVSETELEAIARMSTEALLDEEMVEGAGGDATRGLLGQYGPTPARIVSAMPTPARTAPSGDKILQEAQNLARLQNLATPLIGGENPDLNPSDFSGITPRPTVAATPNPLAAATPGLHAGAGAGGMSVRRGAGGAVIAGVPTTPSVAGTPLRPGALAPGATPMRTPIRDELGLNDADSLAGFGVGGARGEKARLAALRSDLRAGLSSLPAPQNEYQLVAPDLPDDAMDQDAVLEEDAADVKARKLAEEKARAEEEEKKKSKALQRHLPRPVSTSLLPAPRPAYEADKLSLKERAEDLLARELRSILDHDAAKYPIITAGARDSKEARKAAKRAAASAVVPAIDQFELPELQAAAKLLEEETAYLIGAMGHAEVPDDEYLSTWATVHKDLMWCPAKQRYDRVASATPAERVESTKHEFDLVRSEMEREAKRARKVEEKVGILITGLVQRDAKLRKQAEEAWEQVHQAATELECFKALNEREQRAAPERIEAMVELVAAQKEKEKMLQERYKGLMREHADLTAALQAAKA